MLRKLVFALALLAVAAPAAAQSPFEKIHGDILRKAEMARALRSSPLRPGLAPQPRPSQLLYDVLHYTIDVAINPTSRIVQGSVTARITLLAGTFSFIEIDADNALTISGVRRAPGDTLEWVNETYTIRDVQPWAPDGVTIGCSMVVST